MCIIDRAGLDQLEEAADGRAALHALGLQQPIGDAGEGDDVLGLSLIHIFVGRYAS